MVSLVRLLFRDVCAVCGEVLVRGEGFVCSGCLSEMPLNEGEDEAGDEELRRELGVENLFWLFSYNRGSDFHRVIYSIKYRSNRKLAVWAGQMLGRRIGKGHGIDCVVPVPLHRRREKERGYNQSRLIGTGIAGVLGIEVEAGVLCRVVNTTSQTGLSGEERARNVANAFATRDEGRLRGKHVLLVDDVITSGATLKACLTELRKVEGVRCSVASLGKAHKI